MKSITLHGEKIARKGPGVGRRSGVSERNTWHVGTVTLGALAHASRFGQKKACSDLG